MPFRFSLDALFHLRQSVEHQQELRLRAANQQVTRARHATEQLDIQIGETQAHQLRELSAGTTAAELRFARQCESALRQHRQTLQREVLRLQKLRDDQQKHFYKVRRERETLESLRDHQLHEYERAQARREQRQQDDLFLMRQAHLRRG